jgi:hypothetical protein
MLEQPGASVQNALKARTVLRNRFMERSDPFVASAYLTLEALKTDSGIRRGVDSLNGAVHA